MDLISSDQVLDAKLTTEFLNGRVQHTRFEQGFSARQRRVRVREVWDIGRRLGRGSGGVVRLEHLRSSTCTEPLPQTRAVKVISKFTLSGERWNYVKELEAVVKFSHPRYAPYFVPSFGWFEDPESIYIASEYLPLGDLQHFMKASPPFSEDEARQIIRQLLEGVGCMHECRFAHRDLKPGNILVQAKSPEWLIKITDFGISKRVQDGGTDLRTMHIGTFGYMAPELLGYFEGADSTSAYSLTVDIWAIGIIAVELLLKRNPFSSVKDMVDYANRKKRLEFTSSETHQSWTATCQQFLEQLLEPNPVTRLTAAEANNHLWIGRGASPMQEEEELFFVSDSPSDAQLQLHQTPATPASIPSLAWSTVRSTNDCLPANNIDIDVSIFEYLTTKNPVVVSLPKLKTRTRSPFYFRPQRLQPWKEFNMTTFKGIYGKQLMRVAHKKGRMLPNPAILQDECIVCDLAATENLVRRWNVFMTKAALHAVHNELHPAIWGNRTRPNDPPRKRKQQTSDLSATSFCEVCQARDAQSFWETRERLPMEINLYPEFDSTRALAILNDEGYWDMSLKNQGEWATINRAYTYCVRNGCRYGCILSTHEAFLFRIRPLQRPEGPADGNGRDQKAIQRELVSRGLMEWVTIPWASHRTGDSEEFSDLTVNFSLWVLHILAGNAHEVNWNYPPLVEEPLIRQPCPPLDAEDKVPAVMEDEASRNIDEVRLKQYQL